MKKLLLVTLGILLFIIVLTPWMLILFAKNQLHDTKITLRENLVEKTPKKVILALFPHPDDEVTVAGTLMKLREDGHEIHIVTLTKGEKGKSSGIQDEKILAEIRTREMQEAADLIGASQLHLLDYPDSGLSSMGLDSLKGIVSDLINQIQPDVLITYDSKVGLYGHPDHRLSGLAVEQIFQENSSNSQFKPQNLFQVTLCSKQIKVARKLSSSFNKNYPKDPSQGLPKPDFSVRTQEHFSQVLEVMNAHESQKKVLKDLMPFHDRVPAWIYSRIFDREYFHEVK